MAFMTIYSKFVNHLKMEVLLRTLIYLRYIVNF